MRNRESFKAQDAIHNAISTQKSGAKWRDDIETKRKQKQNKNQGERGTYKPTPAGTLDTKSSGVELLLEGVDRAPLGDDSLLERAVLEHTAVALTTNSGRGEVLPEEGVVDVAYRAGESTSEVRSDAPLASG